MNYLLDYITMNNIGKSPKEIHVLYIQARVNKIKSGKYCKPTIKVGYVKEHTCKLKKASEDTGIKIKVNEFDVLKTKLKFPNLNIN